MAAFVQDSWKATSTLTLNYGVRWDRIRPWQEKFNQLQTLVKGEQSQVFPGAPQGLVFPGDPGVPASLAPARNNLAPRIGVAWSPDFAAPLSAQTRRALRDRPASGSATGFFTPRMKACRRAS